MARGELRVYLGSAPGVGKTYRMLDEGWRRHQRGTDVVVAFVEDHGRAQTSAQIRDLEVVPRTAREYRGATFEEMDLDAVLARRPAVALVDEFAHTNVPGGRHEKRWQDVDDLLEAGITVITTVNIQHLESVNDVVEKITGVTQRETIPDAVVRRAEQIELVDITPEALRRRMAHGNIYAPEQIDASLSNYFRSGNLTALRELALLWLADRVEDALQRYQVEHGITATWETRERLIVALTGTEVDETLLRRAARIASRVGAELVAVHVILSGTARTSPEQAVRTRELVAELNGRYQELVDDDIAGALVAFARSEHGTQIVLGASRPRTMLRPPSGVVEKVLRHTRDLDVHVIAVGGRRPERANRPRRRVQYSWRRQLGALALTGVSMLLVTEIMTRFRSSLSLSTASLVYLTAVLLLTAWGGALAGIVTALAAFALENYYFVRPLHTFDVARPDDLVSLVVFLVFAVGAAVVVNRFAERSRLAERARAEVDVLTRSVGLEASSGDDLSLLLGSLRAVFTMTGLTLLARRDDEWVAEVVSGDAVSLEASTAQFEVDDEHILVAAGAALDVQDRALLQGFAARIAAGLASRHQREEVIDRRARAEARELRSGLLRAVSHDLEVPITNIDEHVSSLLEPDNELTDEDRDRFLAVIDREVHRLSRLVANLLDAGRLEAGVIVPQLSEVSLDDVLSDALENADTLGIPLDIDFPDDLPLLETDPALLARVISNVVSNACRFSPSDQTVRLNAGVAGEHLELLVVDHGPGIAPAERATLLAPIQRLTEGPQSAGLGLTVATGFMKLLGGRLHFEDTPRGGLTVVIEHPRRPIA